MRWSSFRPVAVLAFAGLVGSCGDSGGPVNSVTRFISHVTALDTSVVAVLVRGTPPASAGGPVAVVTAPPTVINGGSGQVQIVGSASFTTVVVFVFGYPDYYQLTLPAGDTLAQVIVTIAPTLQDSAFNWRWAVGTSASALGPYQDSPVDVVQVGSGDVQVSVSWDVDSDVDLHLVEPGASGEEIYYANSTATSGGTLDLDSNAACSLDHVRNENITYPSVAPPHGTYTVRVDYWDSCSVSKTNYVVTVRVKGQSTKTYSGSFTGTGDQGGAGAGATITTFSY